MSDDGPLVSIRDLAFTYAGAAAPALAGVSLAVHPGELVGVVGRTGAGRTTLGLALNGVVPQLLPGTYEGSVRVAGLDPAAVPVGAMAATVGVVFDDPEGQLSQPTVAEEVALGLENLGVPYAEMATRVDEALDAVGLAGLGDRDPVTLSGGEQQRLAIAAALVMRPRVLFLDEPTANLDPRGRALVFALLARLRAERGVTVLVADQAVELLARHADRIVVLDAGRVVVEGTPSAVFGRVEVLAAAGVDVPAVTAFARAWCATRPEPGALPTTVDDAVGWLETRR